MKTEILDLAKRLRQERLFVGSEKQQLQDLNEKVMKTVEKLTHISWISRQQRTNLDTLILGRLETSPGECCRRAAVLDDVNFVDSYKILGYHESSYGEFLQYLRENPQTLAAILANGEKSGRTGEELHEVSSIIMCSLYGNCVLRQDEEYALQLLRHLMETQLTGADDPCRLLRRESCAFSRIYKAFSEGLFQAKLFLTAALHDPIIKLLMEDDIYLDADPIKGIERFTPEEKMEKFGVEGGEEFQSKVRQYRDMVVGKLFNLTSRFIEGIKGSSYCFPTCLSWVLRQVYQMLSSSSRRASLGGDVLTPRTSAEVDSVCVDLVFSFFLCPAIVNPEPYGIAADAHVTPMARHNLMQVAQILQVLAMRRWDDKADPRQADLYEKFPKGVMTPFLDMVLNGPMDESAASGGVFTHLDGITRNAVLMTEHELTVLVNFTRQVRRTSCEDLDTKALDSLLNCLPVVQKEETSSVNGNEASTLQGNIQASDHGHGLLSAGLKRNFINKVSMVKKRVSPGTQDGHSIEESMDHSGTPHTVDVLVVRFQQTSPECPGMLTEQKFLTMEEHSIEGRRLRHRHLHHSIPRMSLGGNPLASESSLQSQEDEKESLMSGGASGVVGGAHEVLEKRTRFSLSQDEGSIGNTSDNLEAISEAASNHSVSSSLEMDDNAEDQINYDNLSDMVSANVSGRGTPNVSGRDTPSSQVTEGDEVMGGSNRSVGRGSMPDDADTVDRAGGSGLGRQGSLGLGDIRSPILRTVSGRVQPGGTGSATRVDMAGKQQSQEDIQDKFGKFEFRSLLDGHRQRPTPGTEGDETVSLVSDTWSTDVLASDTETIPDAQGSSASLGNSGISGNFSGSSVLPSMLSVGQDPTRDFGPIGPHGVHPQANSLLDVPESLDTVSEAWSTDVLASDSERLTEVDTDDAYSVAARSDDTARSEIEVDIQLENATPSDNRAGNRSPVDRWPQSSAFQRFRQGSTVSVTSSVSSSSSALPPSRQGGLASLVNIVGAGLPDMEVGASAGSQIMPPVSSSSVSASSVSRSEAVVRFADEFGLQMATDLGAGGATQEDRVGSSTSASHKLQAAGRFSAGGGTSSMHPVITVNGSGSGGAASSLLINFGNEQEEQANALPAGADNAAARFSGCDSVGGNAVGPGSGGSSAGSDSQEAMDVDDFGIKQRAGDVSSSDAAGAEPDVQQPGSSSTSGFVDGNKIPKSISFDQSADRDVSMSSDDVGLGKSSKRGFFKGGFRLPFRGRNRKSPRGGSNSGSVGVSSDAVAGFLAGSSEPPLEEAAGSGMARSSAASSAISGGAPSPRRGVPDLLSEPLAAGANPQPESSDDILAKYRKKIIGSGRPGAGVDLPDSSTNSAAGALGAGAAVAAAPAPTQQVVPEDQEVAELMNLGPGESGRQDDDLKSAFEDAKRKLRLVLSTADFQIFPHPPFVGPEGNPSALVNGCDRGAKRGSDDNELRGLLQLQLAEAINVGDRFLAAQIHETLRCISTFDAAGCVKLFRSLKEDYRKRSPYIAYLIRSRQGLLSALSYLERLLHRVEKDKDVCSTFLVSVCASLFMEKSDQEVADFKKEFQRLNASDEKAELVEQFLEQIKRELEKDPNWAAANEEQIQLGSMALERAVMSQIYLAAMYPNGDGDILRDQVLHDHMAKLSRIITPNHKALRIPKVYHLECPWASAQAEIITINAYKAPRDKLNCVCRCAKTIMTLLAIADDKAVSADDFIPVLVYVLIKANPKNLLSTIQYVNSFGRSNMWSGEEQYWWTQFASAVEFIKTIDY